MLRVRRLAGSRMSCLHGRRSPLLVALVAMLGSAGCWPKDDLAGAYAGGGAGGGSGGAAAGAGGGGGLAGSGGSAGAPAGGAGGSGGSVETDAAAPPGEPPEAGTPDASDVGDAAP